jgi:heme-degrading monooxygenase HmoA
MYFCRVLEGKVKPERTATAIHLINERLEQVRKVSGFLFIQVMRQGQDFIAVSSWKTLKDLRGYSESALAQNLLKDLAPLCSEPPQVRTFELLTMAESEEGFFVQDEGGGD